MLKSNTVGSGHRTHLTQEYNRQYSTQLAILIVLGPMTNSGNFWIILQTYNIFHHFYLTFSVKPFEKQLSDTTAKGTNAFSMYHFILPQLHSEAQLEVVIAKSDTVLHNLFLTRHKNDN